MQVRPIKTRIYKEREKLVGFILEHVSAIKENSILVIASKIVALAEGRAVEAISTKQKDALIRKESEYAIRTKHVWLTIKDGLLMANAGIDESNADGKVLLLPKDAFLTAKQVRTTLRKRLGLKTLGVLITDSCPVPLRAGVAGFALGYAGFKGIRDYRGKTDIFGRTLVMTRTDIADGLAAAAGVVMGEGNEQQPIAVITDAPVEFTDRVSRTELSIPLAEDMFYPLFKGLKKSKKS